VAVQGHGRSGNGDDDWQRLKNYYNILFSDTLELSRIIKRISRSRVIVSWNPIRSL
jgi:hypothetical protein